MADLTDISIVTQVREITLTDRLLQKLGSYAQEAIDNSGEISVYGFDYVVQGHTVKGFFVEPKNEAKNSCVIWNRGGVGDFAGA